MSGRRGEAMKTFAPFAPGGPDSGGKKPAAKGKKAGGGKQDPPADLMDDLRRQLERMQGQIDRLSGKDKD